MSFQILEADRLNIPPFHGHHYFTVILAYHVTPNHLISVPGAVQINPGRQEPVVTTHPCCWYCNEPYRSRIADQPCAGPQ